MMEMMGLLRLKDSGSFNIHMHSMSGDMEREERKCLVIENNNRPSRRILYVDASFSKGATQK